MTREKVKKDLRRLRVMRYSIGVAEEIKERSERRLAYLQSLEQTKEVQEQIAKIRKNLSSLQIEYFIKESTEIESRYTEALQSLDPIDRTIIMDAYINGKAYWKIGRDIGYSERGVQNRVSIIIDKLASIL